MNKPANSTIKQCNFTVTAKITKIFNSNTMVDCTLNNKNTL